ncbi:hypothetical protein LXL04_027250 [Taraxacum kok-saghyz]
MYIRVYNYNTMDKVKVYEAHTDYIRCVVVHPKDTNTFASASLDRTIKCIPIIITGSEDGTVRIWHSTTYRLENTLNYGLERVWAVGCMKGSRRVVFRYDKGTIMVKIGREEPVVSMDNSGKIIWSKHNEIQTVNIKIIFCLMTYYGLMDL